MHTQPPGTAVLALSVIALCHACGGGTSSEAQADYADVFRVAGSDTELALVQMMAEQHHADSPEISISVSGGGSGAGLAALIEGRADVANSSRPASAEELEAAGDGLRELVIATDSLAVIVHEDLGIGSLSLEDVGRLYRGEIRNWRHLGGPDRELTLYGRQSNSGTYGYFRDAVLEGDYSPHMLNMNGNAQIVEAVRNDTYGIGYVGVGYVSGSARAREGLTLLSIEVDGEAVSPLDDDAVAAGEYPIGRPLFQYLIGEPPPALRAFLEFELSDTGQRIVTEAGFHPLPEARREQSLAELE